MFTFPRRPARAAAFALILAASAPALANPPGWGGGWGNEWDNGWGRRGYDWPTSLSNRDRQRDNEGEVDVTRFVVDGPAAEALGKGPVSVVVLADDTPGVPGDEPYDDAPPAPTYGPPPPASGGPAVDDERQNATYEAAVIDQLVQAGYETLPAAGGEGQRVELRIAHGIARPPELPHKPVSGEMTVGVSNRGSMMGMGINIDLTKPKKALLSTRLDARIRDAATGEVLWEGHAEIATRDGSDKWTDQAIATELAAALFRKFPGDNGESFTVR